MTVAEKLKIIVENKGITYAHISKVTSIPIDTISKTLRGKRKLTADEMVAICNATETDLNDIRSSA